MGRARELAELATGYDSGGLIGMRNRLINGSMVIDQRNAGAAVTLTSGGIYTLDRWICWEDTDGGATVTQSSTAPSGHINSLLYTVTSADTSLSAAQFSIVAQRIEGFNVADLAFGTASAQPVTLSFWVRSSVTGTFAGSLVNSAGNRSYVFTYAISSANTWEQKTVTIPGDTSGTWVTNSGIGLQVYFSMGAGSDRQTTAGSWAAGNFVGTSSSVNLIGTNGATWHITGVQLEAGSVATPFERRPYGTELALCQRYFITSYDGSAVGTATTTNSIFWRSFGDSSTVTQSYGVYFKQTMRATPTTTIYSTGTGAAANIRDTSDNVDVGAASGGDATDRFTVLTNAAGLTANQTARCHYTASAEL